MIDCKTRQEDKMEHGEEIRECNECDWVGWADDCVTHHYTVICPACDGTTYQVTPDHIKSLRKTYFVPLEYEDE